MKEREGGGTPSKSPHPAIRGRLWLSATYHCHPQGIFVDPPLA